MVRAGFENVGRRIKEERSRSGMTLAELAKAVGVSASYISLVENAKAIPSLTILDKICTRFSIHLSTLFSETEKPAAKGFAVFRRRSHVVVDITDRRKLQVLLPKSVLPLEPVHLKIMPGDTHNSFSTHKGIEFGYVIAGEVEFAIRDKAATVCRAGDSFIYDAMEPHAFVNHGKVDVELLFVALPNLTLNDGLQVGDRDIC